MEHQERIREYYDYVAEAYDAKHGITWEGQHYNWKKYYEAFLDCHIPKKGRILELGCGTGLYTEWFRRRGLQVIAMDISPKMIEKARNRCPDADYHVGDCQDPARVLGEEILAEGLDAIVGINSFSYYVEKGRALGNYERLLKRSGLFVIIDMNGHCPAFKWSEIRNLNEMREWYKVVKECNRSNVTKLLMQAGLSIEYLDLFSFVPNKASKGMVWLLSPFDAILSKLPLVDAIAIRIGVVARKL